MISPSFNCRSVNHNEHFQTCPLVSHLKIYAINITLDKWLYINQNRYLVNIVYLTCHFIFNIYNIFDVMQ